MSKDTQNDGLKKVPCQICLSVFGINSPNFPGVQGGPKNPVTNGVK